MEIKRLKLDCIIPKASPLDASDQIERILQADRTERDCLLEEVDRLKTR